MNILDEDKNNFIVDVGCSFPRVAQEIATEFGSVVINVLRIKGVAVCVVINVSDISIICKTAVRFAGMKAALSSYR